MTFKFDGSVVEDKDGKVAKTKVDYRNFLGKFEIDIGESVESAKCLPRRQPCQ